MVKLFLDPNLKLSQLIVCVVHTLHSVQEYRCTGVLVTCCEPGSMSTDNRPTAGALVQRDLAGPARSRWTRAPGMGRNRTRGEILYPRK